MGLIWVLVSVEAQAGSAAEMTQTEMTLIVNVERGTVPETNVETPADMVVRAVQVVNVGVPAAFGDFVNRRLRLIRSMSGR